MADVIRNQRLALRRKLKELEAYQREVKDRTMVYDCAEKEAAAKDAGLPPDAYYGLVAEDWYAVKNAYHGSLGEQAREVKVIARYCGVPVKKLEKLPLAEWRELYWRWKRKE